MFAGSSRALKSVITDAASLTLKVPIIQPPIAFEEAMVALLYSFKVKSSEIIIPRSFNSPFPRDTDVFFKDI